VAQEQSHAPSPGPSHLWPAKSDGVDVDLDSESDTGTPSSWDPHAGLKPSEMDDQALDADVEMESELLPGGEEVVNTAMVKLMIDLKGCNEPDEEWLPPREKRKVMARNTGMISFTLRPKDYNDLPVFREKKGPLPWA
jgi:hypothetical protein